MAPSFLCGIDCHVRYGQDVVKQLGMLCVHGVFVHLGAECRLHWDCMKCLCVGESSGSDEGNDG